MKKILIIDEKENHADGTGIEFYENLDSELRKLVSIKQDLNKVINIEDEINVSLKFNPIEFECILFHDSYNNRNLDDGQLESFKSKLDNYILFSAGKSPNYSLKTT